LNIAVGDPEDADVKNCGKGSSYVPVSELISWRGTHSGCYYDDKLRTGTCSGPLANGDSVKSKATVELTKWKNRYFCIERATNYKLKEDS